MHVDINFNLLMTIKRFKYMYIRVLTQTCTTQNSSYGIGIFHVLVRREVFQEHSGKEAYIVHIATAP
jgi:hypothetical protein